MPAKRKRGNDSAPGCSSSQSTTNQKPCSEQDRSDCGAQESKTQPALSPLDPATEALPRLIVLGGGVQPVVSRHACVEMGGRQWTVEEASFSKLVLSRVRLEDEDVNFSAAKVAVREEIRQRLQDIRHFEEDSKVLFERMQDEAEDADQLAMELGNCAHMIEFSMVFTHAARHTNASRSV